ncbi:Msc6p KNAG_0E00330 [Huiozyma naganishii CBS 8797]|uniref:Mitochondrial group I intron splicing factor CCM1 n=1 Tax=Huiozyma naganishii (strain ATCC MYA-139 / BCRC 22969 / CBS 8797 / KCTC 17520 / NBRC 10181 / NCYC 3082 / Yp74L-3) TaxID=1071383 RepID=J7S7F2_HUIN7|nr:hypothetical protein KNAG_0E00330 [Kazachstania naganishii CBS 8797]CCK70301.1 hypothetical protein KNAG_0E00330 [Kazachstania naganishii CBS 8797]
MIRTWIVPRKAVVFQRAVSGATSIVQTRALAQRAQDAGTYQQRDIVKEFGKDIGALVKENGTGPVKDLFAQVNDSIFNFKLNHENVNLARSNDLTGSMHNLLKLSIDERERSVEPYEILDSLARYQLARPDHFRLVMEPLLQQGQYQEVLNLWVKFLQVSVQAGLPPRNITQLVVLACVAYLRLPQDTSPDLATLSQILQLDSSINPIKNVPILQVREHFKEGGLDRYKVLLQQCIERDENWYLERISVEISVFKLLLHYTDYASLKRTKVSPQIVDAYIERFIKMQKPLLAMRVYRDFKDDVPTLNNSLLLIVASMDALSPPKALLKIQAVWNSYIKPTDSNGTISADSFIHLFKALFQSGNIEKMDTVWERETPKELKATNSVFETYWGLTLRDHTNPILLETALKKMDIKAENVKTVLLANSLLLKVLNAPKAVRSDFDKLYGTLFTWDKDLKPNATTSAIRKLVAYRFEKEKAGFHFLNIRPTDIRRKLNVVINQLDDLIEVAPVITPIRKFYDEVVDHTNYYQLYIKFIRAEFTKSGGSPHAAEEIFKTYISQPKFTNISDLTLREKSQLSELVNELLFGFASLRKHGSISKLAQYCQFAEQIGAMIRNTTSFNVMNNVRSFLISNKGKALGEKDKKTIETIVKTLGGNKLFRLNLFDVKLLKEVGIKEDLLSQLERGKRGQEDVPNEKQETATVSM